MCRRSGTADGIANCNSGKNPGSHCNSSTTHGSLCTNRHTYTRSNRNHSPDADHHCRADGDAYSGPDGYADTGTCRDTSTHGDPDCRPDSDASILTYTRSKTDGNNPTRGYAHSKADSNA